MIKDFRHFIVYLSFILLITYFYEPAGSLGLNHSPLAACHLFTSCFVPLYARYSNIKCVNTIGSEELQGQERHEAIMPQKRTITAKIKRKQKERATKKQTNKHRIEENTDYIVEFFIEQNIHLPVIFLGAPVSLLCNIQLVGSEFGINSMKAQLHPDWYQRLKQVEVL